MYLLGQLQATRCLAPHLYFDFDFRELLINFCYKPDGIELGTFDILVDLNFRYVHSTSGVQRVGVLVLCCSLCFHICFCIAVKEF
jgi:hypothetical protein